MLAAKNSEEKELLLNFLHESDVPSWYRGTSPFQLEAAEQLANAIRDDSEHESIHRTRQCLLRLGLTPAVSERDLRMLITLSGGNDLALLWFLMELYYKTNNSNKYDSINEQIILSAIKHLDMITTLRELDRILPPGHASKQRQMALKERKRKLMKEKASSNAAARNLVKKCSSPYFEQLERPIPYGRSLYLKRPDHKVRFVRYDAYKDPNYVPPNELNRWYANHTFRTAERVAKQMLREIVQHVCEPANRNVSERERDNERSAARNLCEKHRVEEKQAQLRRWEMLLEKREKCLKSLDFMVGAKRARLEKLRNMLEKEVEMCRLHFRKMTEPHVGDHHTYIRMLGKEGYCEYAIADDEDLAYSCNPKCAKSPSVAVEKKLPKYSNDSSQLHKKNHLLRLSFGGSTRAPNLIDDLRYFDMTSPTSSQHYFVRPQANKPYHFDYAKIFEYRDENERKYFIKNKCVEAMDQQVQQSISKMPDLTPNLGKVAENCANQMWHDNERNFREAHKCETGTEQSNVDAYPADMPRLPFYDCEDKQLMDQMLQSALNEMKKQPKFVLASLPDAYKLPTLREWIYQRYGKRYTRTEQTREMKKSIRIMNAVIKLKLRNVRLPKSSDIANELEQNYGCHAYIMKKAKHERRRYYDRMNAELLNRTRLFWFAMSNFLSMLPQRETFFAYAPSRPADNYLFKPWQLYEFVDAERARRRRRPRKVEA